MTESHIKCKKGDVSKWILLPGDPKRIDLITKNWSSKKEIVYNREFRIVKGNYKDIDVTAVSSGIGCPSTAIAIEELANIGAKGIIRIGTCGGLLEEMQPGDIVIPIAAMRSDGTTKEYIKEDYPAVADLELIQALVQVAKEKGVRFFTGINRTHDAFYESTESFTQLADIKSMRLVSSEMECSAVFLISDLRNLKAGAILVVNTPESPKEVKKNPEIVYQLTDEKKVSEGMDNAIEIALEAIRMLEKKK